MFYNNLLMEISQKYNENRAILVIVKFISQVNIINNLLKKSNKFNYKDIILYNRSDNPTQSDFLNQEIGPKKIIISTNLCGRGTDIKITKECEQNGGLYVILTFQADSERIESQALGRAARKGERGSGKLILNGNGTYENIQEIRNSNENERFNYIMNTFKKKTLFFQKLFNQFCNELNIMRRNNNNKRKIMDIKEKWGLFLLENDFEKLEELEDLEDISPMNPNKQYKKNTAIIKADIIRKDDKGIDRLTNLQLKFKDFINNIFYNNKDYEYINQFLFDTDLDEKNYKISSNKLSLGVDYMKIYKKIIGFKNKIMKSDIEDIYNSFLGLKNKAEDLLQQYHHCQGFIENIKYQGANKDNFLFTQNKEKIKVLEDLINNIDININFINKGNLLQKKYINVNEISIKLGEFEFGNEDIRNYFHDLCLFKTFTLQSHMCNIF